MIERNILSILLEWKTRTSRKPLILKGARQIGKTSIVNHFGKSHFRNFIYLNLERESDKELFQQVTDSKKLITSIEAFKNTGITPGDTLIFIDEIQNSANALKQLRYFYEELPELHVIAAGSLLEAFIDELKSDFPVGRVEFTYMHPVTFDEFIRALGEEKLARIIAGLSLGDSLPPALHQKCMDLFFKYALVGGMPEVSANYINNRDINKLSDIYESLSAGFYNDIGKYSSRSSATYLRHVLHHLPEHVGLQITYAGFGGSKYRSREIALAFAKLEQVQILRRVHSSRSLTLPIVSNLKKMPKLLHLDVGMVNYALNQRLELSNQTQLEKVYRGQIAEQMTGQTLVSQGIRSPAKINYWYRDKPGAEAELDYLIAFKEKLLAIETKAGTGGRLKSLHKFIDESKSEVAVKVCSNHLQSELLKTSDGNSFTLHSVPFYLLHRISELLK